MLLWISFDQGYDLESEHFSADIRWVSVPGCEWMRCHVERGYGNLTPYGSTLWVRVKRHVIHHGCIVMHRRYVEGYYKSSSRHGSLVENTLLIAEGILYVTILYHNILLVFGLIISDIRMMSLISVDQ